MSRQSLSPPRTAPIWRRRLMAVTIVLVAAGGATAVGSHLGSDVAREPSPPPPRVLEIFAGQRSVARVALRNDQPPDRRALGRLLQARLPRTGVARRGRARISYRYDVDATARRATRATRAGKAGGRVQAVRRALSSTIAVAVVRQFARNACEAAALEMLLASTDVAVSQRRLQSAFPRSGPLDPVGTGPGRTWGDPDAGYVGRVEGGGAAGGFGIYPGPVATTARRFGRDLDDLSASSPGRIYARLLAGRAVMAWIGLSDGPYGQWRSPRGELVRVNFGEHTIVLRGITRDGDLRVVNPLQGTFERWSRTRFEAAWELLGRRALAARR